MKLLKQRKFIAALGAMCLFSAGLTACTSAGSETAASDAAANSLKSGTSTASATPGAATTSSATSGATPNDSTPSAASTSTASTSTASPSASSTSAQVTTPTGAATAGAKPGSAATLASSNSAAVAAIVADARRVLASPKPTRTPAAPRPQRPTVQPAPRVEPVAPTYPSNPVVVAPPAPTNPAPPVPPAPPAQPTTQPTVKPAVQPTVKPTVPPAQTIATATNRQITLDQYGQVATMGTPYRPMPFAPTTAAVPAAKGETFGYSFPISILDDPTYQHGAGAAEGEEVEGESRAFALAKLDAVVGVPAGNTPRPVVYIMHATFPNCFSKSTELSITPDAQTIVAKDICIDEPHTDAETGKTAGHDYVQFERGMTYLVNALRDAGFVAVSIDTVASDINYVHGYVEGDAVKSLLLQQHRKIMAGFAAGNTYGLKVPANLKSVIDTSKYALVGHSSSGGFALTEAGVGGAGMFAAVGLQPAINSDVENAPASVTKVPMLAIAGSCDEQVPLSGIMSDTAGLLQRYPDSKFVGVTIAGTSHAAMNQFSFGPVPFASEAWSPECARPKQATQTNSLEAGSALIVAFLQQSLVGAKAYVLPSGAGAPSQIWYQYNIAASVKNEVLPGVNTAMVPLQNSTHLWGRAWDKEAYPAFSPSGGDF